MVFEEGLLVLERLGELHAVLDGALAAVAHHEVPVFAQLDHAAVQDLGEQVLRAGVLRSLSVSESVKSASESARVLPRIYFMEEEVARRRRRAPKRENVSPQDTGIEEEEGTARSTKVARGLLQVRRDKDAGERAMRSGFVSTPTVRLRRRARFQIRGTHTVYSRPFSHTDTIRTW